VTTLWARPLQGDGWDVGSARGPLVAVAATSGPRIDYSGTGARVDRYPRDR